MSHDTVSQSRWRIMLLLLLLVLSGGITLTLLLALGFADPPRAGGLRWQSDHYKEWSSETVTDQQIAYRAPITLPDPPFTLELTARNQGMPESAWGFWLTTVDGRWSVLISNEGYFSTAASSTPDWAEFIHIQPSNKNKLYLHVEFGGRAVLRINDEVAWTGTVDLLNRAEWGLIVYRQPQLLNPDFRLYG